MKKTWIKRILEIIFVLYIIFLFLLGIWNMNIFLNNRNNNQIQPTINPNTHINTDTIYLKKDTIIYKIQRIKEIQYDTIEKVYNLNDTATINLFYKLVAK
jgi:hypothetical protein